MRTGKSRKMREQGGGEGENDGVERERQENMAESREERKGLPGRVRQGEG